MSVLDDIEYRIAANEMTAMQVYTQMTQLVDFKCDQSYRHGFNAGWNAGKTGDEKALSSVNSRENRKKPS